MLGLFRRKPAPASTFDADAYLRDARPPRDLSPDRIAALRAHSPKFAEAHSSIAKADIHADEIRTDPAKVGRKAEI